MNAGKLNRKLIIQRQVKTPDGAGGNRVEWQEDGYLWGKIEEFEPTEIKDTGKDRRIARYRVTIRKTNITTEDRLIYNGRELEIDYIKNQEERPPFYMELDCKEMRLP